MKPTAQHRNLSLLSLTSGLVLALLVPQSLALEPLSTLQKSGSTGGQTVSVVKKTFQKLDADKNGSVTAAEATRGRISSTLFKRHDVDKSQALSSDEFVLLYQDLLVQAKRPVAKDLAGEVSRIQAARKVAASKGDPKPAGAQPAPAVSTAPTKAAAPAKAAPAPQVKSAAAGKDAPTPEETARRIGDARAKQAGLDEARIRDARVKAADSAEARTEAARIKAAGAAEERTKAARVKAAGSAEERTKAARIKAAKSAESRTTDARIKAAEAEATAELRIRAARAQQARDAAESRTKAARVKAAAEAAAGQTGKTQGAGELKKERVPGGKVKSAKRGVQSVTRHTGGASPKGGAAGQPAGKPAAVPAGKPAGKPSAAPVKKPTAGPAAKPTSQPVGKTAPVRKPETSKPETRKPAGTRGKGKG